MPRETVFVIAALNMAASSVVAQADSSEENRRLAGIAAGIGVTLVLATDIVDYINLRYLPASRLDDFSSAAEFYGAGEMQFSESWGVKIEYAFLLKSYSVTQQQGPDILFSYGVHMPTAVAQRMFRGEGYDFKLGGGLGYAIAQFSEEASSYPSNEYTSHGVGLKLETEADTEFDDHLFGHIAVDARKTVMSPFRRSDGTELPIPVRNRSASMNFFSLGLKFGLMYYF